LDNNPALGPRHGGLPAHRNREGYDVYFRPYAGDHNAGYILPDLDHPVPGILARLRAQGHQPCVVIETSPGRWQAWIRVSAVPLVPPLATWIAKLAEMYGVDRASADWRHLGRLVGFINRKPERRQRDGLAPWVNRMYARSGLAPNAAALLEAATAEAPAPPDRRRPFPSAPAALAPSTDSRALHELYQVCVNRLGIRECYPFARLEHRRSMGSARTLRKPYRSRSGHRGTP
jgi:hypothetical protein